MKVITLITKGKNTLEALKKQLEYFFEDEVVVRGYYLDRGINYDFTCDLVLISSEEVYLQVIKHIEGKCPIIIAQRSLNYHEISKLLNIPSGTDVLLVNDLPNSVYETISVLNALGIDHINYHPYYPGIDTFPILNIAVTPGELELVPSFVETIIDIKTRNIDFVTMVEIIKALGISKEKSKLLSARYIKDIIDLIKITKEMADNNNNIKNQLQTIINTVHDGIIALDEKERISVFNPIAEEIFSSSKDDVLGRRLSDNSLNNDFMSVLQTDNMEEERFIKVNDRHIIVRNTYIKENNKSVGTVFTLKDVTEIQRLEEELRRKLITQENYARYTFANIIGDSEPIIRARRLAEKIAKSDSPVLIQGESGTGKEFFAQAIHNASLRKNGPFVAVNFAALPESLLESELFGYDEGAFTGAKKGGKPGLFEQAHGGTIFLDEIGDAPILFQIRLLRVLQEKQVRRIGSSRVIPINIRVISATNKDLKALIKQGLFREDLFYRLNVLPLKIPPLRERKQDIIALSKVFYTEYFNNKPIVKFEDYFKHIKAAFIDYDWPGNVRELHNVVEYLTNVSPKCPPDLHLLPEELISNVSEICSIQDDNTNLTARELLYEIGLANERGESVGRRSLSKKLGISEGKLRNLIQVLSKKGYVTVRRGRKGLILSLKALNLISDFNQKTQ